jgi:hypothetical protein
MAQLYNRAGVATATIGTSTITLGAALAAGTPINSCSFQTFASAGVGGGIVVPYLILDSNGSWEYGTGTYTSSDTRLSRTLGQSNTGALLNLSGSAQVFITAREQDIVNAAGDTMTGTLTIAGSGAGILGTQLTDVANTDRFNAIESSSGGGRRWGYGILAEPETGSNAGSNFFLFRYSDAGGFIDSPLVVNRATGAVTLSASLAVGGGVSVSSNAAITGSASAASISVSSNATITGTVSAGAVGGNAVATQAEQETGTATDRIVSPGRQHFHPSAAKAWVRWDNAGTRDTSYNVSSITDNANGDWTVNFTTAFSAATNYVGVGIGAGGSTVLRCFMQNTATAPSTTAFRVAMVNAAATLSDSPDKIYAAFFGDQ